ncbi:protein O-mannosyl-transferase TMTC2-like [Schistocerca serialis cubense]|uniref:protein O-mannosyl-transferase TMTC2-like n=1 Tax=Schistocerca serialis cubense TaxID=2023355 RepID=UPI00214E92CF|nr:protein O-mannosyl-transferase TMTC2-like [Schistocerca serialis cubense]
MLRGKAFKRHRRRPRAPLGGAEWIRKLEEGAPFPLTGPHLRLRLPDICPPSSAAACNSRACCCSQALYNLLGETLVRMRHYEQAEQWFRAALQAEPQHVPAHVTYGSLLAMNRSRAAEAERWFRRALQLAPEDPSVHQHFGQFLSGQQRHAEAALRFEAAADLLPSRLDLALAAASSLRVAGLTGRAERFYRRAVQLRPQSARHHLNLGAILHLNGRYDEAAACYREALRLQPDDATALTNLQKLRSLMAARRPSKL